MYNRQVLELPPWATVANICVICDREFFSPLDQRVYKEAKTMVKMGHNVEIITPHKSTKIKKIENIIVHCIEKRAPFGFTGIKIIKKALEKEYDLFYCHEFDPLIYGWIIKKITKKSVVWDCHEYLIPMKRELQGDMSAFLAKYIIKFAATKIDHIITVDNILGRQLQKLNSVTVIPNYPTIEDFPLLKNNINNKVPNIIYVGSLTEQRGLKKMMKAYKIVKDNFEAELTVIGGFYDIRLEKWAKNYDSQNKLNINWKGWIKYTELAPHFSKADLGLCILQDSERYMKAIATKVYEYVIMGIPVVTSKGHMSDRLVKEEKCGISVDSSNENAIADGILTLLNRVSKVETNINSVQSSRSKYVWEKRENNLNKVIKKLV